MGPGKNPEPDKIGVVEEKPIEGGFVWIFSFSVISLHLALLLFLSHLIVYRNGAKERPSTNPINACMAKGRREE
jgi:hypothetical protein